MILGDCNQPFTLWFVIIIHVIAKGTTVIGKRLKLARINADLTQEIIF